MRIKTGRLEKEDCSNSTPIATDAVHHLRLTVSDIVRSRTFYTDVSCF